MGEIVFVLNKEEGIRILEFKLKFEKKKQNKTSSTFNFLSKPAIEFCNKLKEGVQQKTWKSDTVPAYFLVIEIILDNHYTPALSF